MEMPRRCSSGRRSVSLPVSPRTSHVLPWSMWPAVPTVSGIERTLPRRMLAAMARVLGWVVVTALLGGAAYELALALGFESTRVSKGEDAPGEVWVFLGALIAMLVGAGLAVAWMRRPRLDAALLAPAAAAFVAAFL